MSPIYENENTTREDLEKLAKRNRCKVCGERLDMFLDVDQHKAFLACTDWRRTQHEGIERPPSRYEMGGISELTIERRREIMTQEYGKETTTALAEARLPMSGALTQPQAEHILSLVYPGVPRDEIIRCAILCRDFGLHPLMKEVYILGFKNKEGGTDYTTVIGISASRKMAADKKGAYSFIDGTPRAATHEEIVKQFGEHSDEERDNLISICMLKGEKGNEATGFGLWPKGKEPYGGDKGNTKRNMANIRSERPAYSRLPGGVLPPIEIIDEAYAEVPDVGKVAIATGEIMEVDDGIACPFERIRSYPACFEDCPDTGKCPRDKAKESKAEQAPAVTPPPAPALGICPIHNKPLVAGRGSFPAYCQTRVPGTGKYAGKEVWCKGKYPEGFEPPVAPEETKAETPASNVNTPAQQSLYDWITQHGKDEAWFHANFNYTVDDLKDDAKVKSAFAEVRSIAGWED